MNIRNITSEDLGMVVHTVIPALRSWRIYKFVASLTYMRREGEGKEKGMGKEKEGEAFFLIVQCTNLTMLLSWRQGQHLVALVALQAPVAALSWPAPASSAALLFWKKLCLA